MKSNLFIQQHLPSAYQPPGLVEKFLRTTGARCYHEDLGLQRGETVDPENKGGKRKSNMTLIGTLMLKDGQRCGKNNDKSWLDFFYSSFLY